MYEIDFLAVGDRGRSGDAICMRFTRPDTGTQAIVVIDAGFKANGEALVGHIETYYGGDTTVDLAILTHPDGDHIGGMGEVIRGLDVQELWVHDLGAHGGSTLPAADAVEELVTLATQRGTLVQEAWTGTSRFGGAITVLGPSETYYDELVEEQVAGLSLTASVGKALLAAVRGVKDRIADELGLEVPFEAKEVNPRNNSSMVVLAKLDGEAKLFTADAGVPALSSAWDYAELTGLAEDPSLVQIPHHGSRRNCSSEWLDRLLGPTGQSAGTRSAIVSCVADSDKHPSGKVVNAYQRRGCSVVVTAGQAIRYSSPDAPPRHGWSPVTPLGPMLEEDD